MHSRAAVPLADLSLAPADRQPARGRPLMPRCCLRCLPGAAAHEALTVKAGWPAPRSRRMLAVMTSAMVPRDAEARPPPPCRCSAATGSGRVPTTSQTALHKGSRSADARRLDMCPHDTTLARHARRAAGTASVSCRVPLGPGLRAGERTSKTAPTCVRRSLSVASSRGMSTSSHGCRSTSATFGRSPISGRSIAFSRCQQAGETCRQRTAAEDVAPGELLIDARGAPWPSALGRGHGPEGWVLGQQVPLLASMQKRSEQLWRGWLLSC